MYKQTRNVMDLERWSRDSGKAATYIRAVSVDKWNCNIYVTEVGQSPQISVYSCDGELITRFNHELMASPWGLVVDGLDIYVTDIALHSLLHFREDGPFVQVKMQSDYNNPLKEPRQIALSERGELYIADYGNHRVQVWDKNLKFIRNIEHTSLSYPIDVKVTSREIYVLSFIAISCIHVFSQSGEILRSIISNGSGMQVSKPYFFCINHLKQIIISDARSYEIKIFSQEGEFLCTVVPERNETGKKYSLLPIAMNNDSEFITVTNAAKYAFTICS